MFIWTDGLGLTTGVAADVEGVDGTGFADVIGAVTGLVGRTGLLAIIFLLIKIKKHILNRTYQNNSFNSFFLFSIIQNNYCRN